MLSFFNKPRLELISPFPQVAMEGHSAIQIEPKKLINNENAPYINGKDVFITSFPRSGNTWMRLMLVDLFWQLSGNDTMGKKLPLLYFSPTLEKCDFQKLTRPDLGFFLIKTHSVDIAEYNRFIYLFRNPIDSITSHYRFLKKRPITYMEDGLEKHCLEDIGRWNRHIQRAYAMRKKALILSYEDMLMDTHTLLAKACEFLGFPATMEHIERAVKNQSMDAALKIKATMGLNLQANYILAHGTKNAGRQYISDELAERITKETQKFYIRINRSRYTALKTVY